MSNNLKPVRCGCCGKADIGFVKAHQWFCYCTDCGVRTPLCRTRAEAIKVWNKAMGVDKVDELIEHIWREKLDTREKIADLVERMLM